MRKTKKSQSVEIQIAYLHIASWPYHFFW